jgi:hypothetical protein
VLVKLTILVKRAIIKKRVKEEAKKKKKKKSHSRLSSHKYLIFSWTTNLQAGPQQTMRPISQASQIQLLWQWPCQSLDI